MQLHAKSIDFAGQKLCFYWQEK